MPSRLLHYAFCFFALATVTLPAITQTSIQAILPNGRQIRPAGNWIPLAPYPFAIALKPDGSQAAIPSIGFPFALNVIDHPDTPAPSVRRMPNGEDSDPAIETHAGLAYSKDGQILYVATGNSGKIALYSTTDWHPLSQISLDQKIRDTDFAHSFAATVLLSTDGHTLYALDQANWRVAILDVSDPAVVKIIASIDTGVFPFGAALSPDGTRLYVTNTGLFEYSLIPGAKKEDELGTGLKFAPFGYPSKEAREGNTVDNRRIPGLGDENSTRGSSLWTYDIHDPAHPAITAKLRLGDRITETSNGDVGGAAPTGVAAGADAVFVSLAHQDSIARISPDGAKLLAETPLTPFAGAKFQDAQGRPLRGIMPSGLALRDGKRSRSLTRRQDPLHRQQQGQGRRS
jgi:DNA-binding beta-propeller fold protein YncE